MVSLQVLAAPLAPLAPLLLPLVPPDPRPLPRLAQLPPPPPARGPRRGLPPVGARPLRALVPLSLVEVRLLQGIMLHMELETKANQRYAKISQSWRRTLLGPSPG